MVQLYYHSRLKEADYCSHCALIAKFFWAYRHEVLGSFIGFYIPFQSDDGLLNYTSIL